MIVPIDTAMLAVTIILVFLYYSSCPCFHYRVVYTCHPTEY